MIRLKFCSVPAIVLAGLFLSLALLVVTGVLTRGPMTLADSVSNGDGTGSGTGTVLGTPVLLAETFSTDLKGDYVAAGVGMRGTGAGTITLPALPGGSTVENAFLYWAVMNPSTTPALASGNINTNAITGTLIGKTANPCWIGGGDIHNYVADVTSFVLPGANALTGFASGGDLTTPPLLEGAAVVVVYSNPASSDRTVIIREGAISFILPPPETTTFSGFSAAAGTSQTTYIVADGQQDPGGIGFNNRTYVDATMTADYTLNGAGPGTQYWDTLTQDISTFIPPSDTAVTIGVESTADLGIADCLTWVAQVVSVPAEAPTPTPPPTPGPPAVGGIVELHVDADAPADVSAPSSSGYTLLIAIAALIASAVVTLSAGGWYTRTRFAPRLIRIGRRLR